MHTLPQYGMQHIGVTELVGKDEQVDQNELGAEVAATMSQITGVPVSGEFLAFIFYATEEGSGAVQDSQGELLIFTAAPGLTAGDRWCLCVERWTEALDAGVAPPVILEATHISAMAFVDIDELMAHALPVA